MKIFAYELEIKLTWRKVWYHSAQSSFVVTIFSTVQQLLAKEPMAATSSDVKKNESSHSKSLFFQTIYHGLLECFFSDRFALYLIFWTHWIFEEDMRLFDGEYLLLLTSRKTLTIGGKRPLAVEDLVWMCDKHYHHFSFIMRFLRLFMLVMLVSIHFNHTENWRCRDRDIFKLVYSLCKLTETMYLWRPKTMPEMSPSATEKPKT